MTLKTITERIKTEVLKYPKTRKCALLDYRINLLQYGTNAKKDNIIKGKEVYSFEVINDTLNLAFEELKQCFNTMSFNNEAHKVNTILLIMTKHIDDAINKKSKKEKVVTDLNNLDNNCLNVQKGNYVRKSKDLKDKYKELWE